jgi:multiple sugar transport system ATP-binding protein
MPTLSLQHVTKIFPGNICAVNDFSLDVADGEQIVLVGPSGCGKSTVLRLIAGLEQPDGGTVAIDGRCVNRLPPHKRDVAMVFQHLALYPHLNVYGNLAFGLKLQRVDKSEIVRRVTEAAAMLGLDALLDRKPWELSGGQQQRVALGRAIVRRPKIFLLDEPLSHLDAALREEMRRDIARLQKRLGIAMIYVTHDQTEAMTLGRRVVAIWNGRTQQIADPETLYRRPANRFVAALIGSPKINFLPGRVERRGEQLVFQFTENSVECAVRTPNHTEPAWPVSPAWKTALDRYLGGDPGKKIILGIRPEHVRLGPAHRSDGTIHISTSVESIESLGDKSIVYLRTACHPLVTSAAGEQAVRPGESVTAIVGEENFYFFDPQTDAAIAKE